MSFRAIRQSKYRHVFGTAMKREQGYDGVKISRNAWDSPFCSVNLKFVAVCLEAQGGGAFCVIPLDKTGRLDLNFPRVVGHTMNVLDIQFCPYNDNLIASASEDLTVKVWEIPDGGLTSNLTDATVTLTGHQRRVGIVSWHPTAENILASAGFDYLVMIWNIGTGECIKELDMHTDTIYSLSWSPLGDMIATTSKDKQLRVIDPRKGEVITQGKSHEGTKASRCVFLGQDKLFTTGFSRMSERQYGVWDAKNLDKPLKVEQIDTASGVLFIYQDPDTQMLYLAGKGDGNVRYYEWTDEAPYVHFLNEYKSSAPQRGLGMMPKRGMKVMECEIARFYKLHPKGFIEPIFFTVPRKAPNFQKDIFPDTKEDVATMSAEEWLGGANTAAKLISLADGIPEQVTKALETVAKAPEEPAENKPPKGEKELLKAWHEQKKEIAELKAQLATAEIKIRQLSKQ